MLENGGPMDRNKAGPVGKLWKMEERLKRCDDAVERQRS